VGGTAAKESGLQIDNFCRDATLRYGLEVLLSGHSVTRRCPDTALDICKQFIKESSPQTYIWREREDAIPGYSTENVEDGGMVRFSEESQTPVEGSSSLTII
jgi:hypothetical protein